jgi:broad specificity phosphatase PhoE
MTERCIYLVRHGETAGESSIRYHGRNDVPLSDLGCRQVEGLIGLIRHVSFAAVIHSPLSRAKESARILVEGLLREPGVVEEAPDLTEVYFGEMEGMTDAEIAAALPEFYAEWKSGRAKGFPGGETYAAFDARVGTALDGLMARYPEGHLLIVAHMGIIRRGAGRLLQMSREAMSKLNPALGSLTVLSCENSSNGPFQLKHWSLTSEPK